MSPTETATRTESDTFGPIEVPAHRDWGAQTQRSIQNFKIGTERMPAPLVHALGLVKQAAALVNKDLGVLEPKLADAIAAAAATVVDGEHDAHTVLAEPVQAVSTEQGHASHTAHAVDPVPEAYAPVGHDVHPTVPVVRALYAPTAHCVHTLRAPPAAP